MPVRQSYHRHLSAPVMLAALMACLAGCGSSRPSKPSAAALVATHNAPKPNASSELPTTVSTTPSSSEPSDAAGPPSFVVHSTTEQGDRVKLEGWFRSAQTAQESDVEQYALSGCPPPANDGRAMVVRLDTAITLESSLSGQVGFATGNVAGSEMAFVMGYSGGATCLHGEPGATMVELHTMQPGETRHFTMWLALPNAITPSDPHPSEQTLGKERWLMMVPQPSVDGSGYNQDRQNSVSGPRVVRCHSGGESGGPGLSYLAVVADTPRTMSGEQSTMGEGPCPLE